MPSDDRTQPQPTDRTHPPELQGVRSVDIACGPRSLGVGELDGTRQRERRLGAPANIELGGGGCVGEGEGAAQQVALNGGRADHERALWMAKIEGTADPRHVCEDLGT